MYAVYHPYMYMCMHMSCTCIYMVSIDILYADLHRPAMCVWGG